MIAVGMAVEVRAPWSPSAGRFIGVVEDDGGVAERGPDRGRQFWWVRVDGRAYPLLHCETELVYRHPTRGIQP